MKPDEAEQWFVNESLQPCSAILAELCRLPGEDRAARAAWLLGTRIVNSARSIECLVSAEHESIFDAVAIIRTAYDALIQLLYILDDHSRRNERAGLCLDFLWIEKHHLRDVIDQSDTDIGRRLAGSPMRAAGETALEHQLLQLGPQYETRNGKYRKKWYKETLRDLAKAVGYESEYDILQLKTSAFVHSGCMPLLTGSFIKPQYATDWAIRFSHRACDAIIRTFAINVNEEFSLILAHARRNIFDAPDA